MIYVLVVFLLIVIAVLLLYRSPSVPITPIDNWRNIYKFLSAQIAALAGTLVAAIPALEKLNELLPQFETISYLRAITDTGTYHLIAACVAFSVILARSWKQDPGTKP